MATSRGLKEDEAYREAYWRAFDRFFGTQNAAVIKAMLLAKYEPGEAGRTELDRVCYGLRKTMGWIAEAIEHAAVNDVERASGAGEKNRVTAGV